MYKMLIRSKQVPFTLSACIEHKDNGVHGIILKAIDRPYVQRMKGLHIAYESHDSHHDANDRAEFYNRAQDVRATLAFQNLSLDSLAFSGEHIPNYVLETVFGPNWHFIRHIAYRHSPELPSIATPYLQNIVDLEMCLETLSPRTCLAELPLLLSKLPMLETLVIKDERLRVSVPRSTIG
ncbi:hypothetical protein EWM64_g1395 [Hericium alpestre]|uniref:F-box domain-containing protein n=1 Tax=Hericium alpestre TaxID=135208 RepID=A0A4Z0A8F5_9AGAM|nr:hypothetical protein EWM64_g1395 [Hericium alpestre]